MPPRPARLIRTAVALTCAALAGCDDPSPRPAARDAAPPDGPPPLIDAAPPDATPDAHPDATPEPDAAPPCGPTLRYDPDGSHWLDTPWPSPADLTAGSPDLDRTPMPDIALTAPYRAVAATLDGFGLNGAAYAAFDGPLDPDAAPTPAETLAADAPVQLIVVDGPEAGRRIPLDVGVPSAADAWVDPATLLARPVPGFVLPEAATVCVAWTDRIRGADGCPARPAPGFLAALDRDPSLAPLAADPPPGLVGGTCYPTRRATHRLDAALAHARAAPLGPVTLIGYDDYGGPPRRILELAYEAPSYQSGEAPWTTVGTGGLTFDADGPVARRALIFAHIALPDADPPPGGFPVVQYAAGTGGDRTVCPAIMRQAYASGHAVACIDRPGLGRRGDGSEPPWPDFRNPFASLGTMAQEVVDHLTLSRILGALAAGEVDPGEDGPPLPPISTDPPALLGFSQGALMAGIAAGVLPELDAVIIDSGGGLAIEGALLRPDSAPVVALFAPLLGIADANLDGRHPAVAVLQMLADEVDPITYAGRWFGPGLPDVLILSGTRDTKTLTAFANALAVAGRIPLAEPILIDSPGHALIDLPPVTLPIAGNRDGRTAALIQAEAGHGLRRALGEAMDHWLRTRLPGPPEAR